MASAAPAIINDDPPAGDPPAGDPPVSNDPPANDPPANDPPAGDPPAGDPPANDDDWRSRLAGGDSKLLGFLGRYQSEKAFVEAAKKDRDAARAKSAAKLPDNPTDDELVAYRAEYGIPEAPEGYYEKLADGLVVGDADKPFVDMFLKEMHGSNAPPAVVNAALDAYYGIVEEQAAAESTAAKALEQASIEDLRSEWGADYKRNLNVMHGYLETLPAVVADAFRHGKGADGLPLGYNADVLRWLTAQAMEANPVATVVPGAGANQASAIAEEMAAIKAKMGTPEYTKNPALQARYLELVEADQKLKQRA